MNCVYKEYEVKNGKGAMTTAKNEVFTGLQHENCYLVVVISLWWGWIKIWWGSLLGGGGSRWGD